MRRHILQITVFAVTICMILFLILATDYYTSSKSNNADTLKLSVLSDGVEKSISLWKSEEEKYYCFLPSYADLNTLKPAKNFSEDLRKIDGVSLPDFSFDKIVLDKEYSFETDGETFPLIFTRSSGVATMYIDTSSGTMENVHNDKKNKEKIRITVFDKNGKKDYSSNEYADIIDGHGNSTWWFPKKPYNISLNTDASILSMPAGKHWVLLANAIDETNLRNEIVLDTAKQIDYGWSPSCEYTDLYLNGEYAGLYLLAEKVEISPSKVNVSPANGVLVCQIERNRIELKNGFSMDSGMTFYINEPEKLYSEKRKQAISHMQEVENSILNGTWEKYIDAKSWADKFLIEELFRTNEISSLYSYWDKDGVIYAGPAWDYDGAIGNAFFTRSHYSNPTALNVENNQPPDTWANFLYQNEDFKKLFIKEYEEKLKDTAHYLAETGIREKANKIKKASELNSVRWKEMFDSQPIHTDVDFLIDYLSVRVSFLDGYWLEGKTYKNVTFEGHSPRRVECGQPFGKMPDPSLFLLSEDTVWYDKSTGKPFDPYAPVSEDIELYPVYSERLDTEYEKTEEKLPDKEQTGILYWILSNKASVSAILVCVLFAVSGVYLAVIVIVRSKRERRPKK